MSAIQYNLNTLEIFVHFGTAGEPQSTHGGSLSYHAGAEEYEATFPDDDVFCGIIDALGGSGNFSFCLQDLIDCAKDAGWRVLDFTSN